MTVWTHQRWKWATVPVATGRRKAVGIARLTFVFLLGLIPSLPLMAEDSEENEERRLVLVSTTEAEVVDLSLDEIRRVFLGIPVRQKDRLIEAVINESDSLAYEVFLQTVVFHSARSYERYLIKRVFQEGGRRPARVTAMRNLPNVLADREGRVSFAWHEWAEERDDVQVVRELWRGSPD